MKFTNYIQGTKEWLAWRKTGVTASDAAIINGTNTFGGNSPLKLYRKKFELAEEEAVNSYMEEGTKLEKEALEWFNKNHNTVFIKPPGAHHDRYVWLLASLDGYDKNNKDYLLEIKCGAATYEKAKEGIVPPYYQDQIQHQLFVADKKFCYYLSYRPDKEPIVIIVEKDEEYFKKVFEKEKEFYNCMVNLIPPALSEKEFVEIKEPSSNKIAENWKKAKEALKEAEKIEKLAREALKDETDGGNCIFPDAFVKVELRNRKGLIDYDKVCKEYGISKTELEKFRKPSSSGLYPIIIKGA